MVIYHQTGVGLKESKSGTRCATGISIKSLHTSRLYDGSAFRTRDHFSFMLLVRPWLFLMKWKSNVGVCGSSHGMRLGKVETEERYELCAVDCLQSRGSIQGGGWARGDRPRGRKAQNI